MEAATYKLNFTLPQLIPYSFFLIHFLWKMNMGLVSKKTVALLLSRKLSLLERFSIECWMWFSSALVWLYVALWFVAKIFTYSQPTRRETKTNLGLQCSHFPALCAGSLVIAPNSDWFLANIVSNCFGSVYVYNNQVETALWNQLIRQIGECNQRLCDSQFTS